jgi:hypothetical protein
MATLTKHEMRPTTFSQLRNRHECYMMCTCGVVFSRWGDDKTEAKTKARAAMDNHLEAIRKARS